MGFFSWLMKGVDIDGQNNTKTINPPLKKDFNDGVQLNDLQELSKKEKEYTFSIDEQRNANSLDNRLGLNSEKYAPRQVTPPKAELLMFKVSSHKDIQAAVSHLSKQQPCIVDLEKVNKKDKIKMMDFLSGAVFALKGTMHPVKGDNYILSPEGMTISLQEKIKK